MLFPWARWILCRQQHAGFGNIVDYPKDYSVRLAAEHNRKVCQGAIGPITEVATGIEPLLQIGFVLGLDIPV